MTGDSPCCPLSSHPDAIAANGEARRSEPTKSTILAEAGLAHLHPGIREIALADDTVRLQAIRAKRWITHQPASRVLASLQEALMWTAPRVKLRIPVVLNIRSRWPEY